MELCKNCGLNNGIKYSKYASGDFCSIKCTKSYSTKDKRCEINLKVSKTLTGKKKSEQISKICPECKNEFLVKKSKNNQVCCSIRCSKNSQVFKDLMSKIASKRCESIDERLRLKEIGRIGGFGNKGQTKNGVYYQSTFEKNVFEYLDEQKISYIPHKDIPNSSKISDVYLPYLDLWVELDGIDREKKKKWLGKDYEYWLTKIEIYKRENLNFVIVKTFSEFKKKLVP